MPIPEEVHPQLRAALERTGITALWSHQADAWDAVMRRGHTIVTTGTASGKSLCFNLPVLHMLSLDPRARALYLYPTKALAQDQARRAHRSCGTPPLRHAIYDGDTPRAERAAIRKQSNLVLTNPDMLHVGILPNHGAWGDFLANLALVVVDEAHVYRGVFGSHVANVLRRLRRLAAAYGTTPRFVLTSRDDREPARASPRGSPATSSAWSTRRRAARRARDRHVQPAAARRAHWAARVQHQRGRRSLFADLVRGGVRTICFARSRGAAAELIYKIRAGDRLERLRRADRALPGRLHAAAAARDRARLADRAS